MKARLIDILTTKINSINIIKQKQEVVLNIDTFLSKLSNDIPNIEIDELTVLLKKIDSNYNSEEIINNLLIIKTLLSVPDLGFELDTEQEKILLELKQYLIEKKKELTELIIKNNSIDISNYQSLLNKINNDKNDDLIVEIDLLANLFEEQKISSEEQNKIWQYLLHYNFNIYNHFPSKIKEKDFNEIKETNLSIQDVVCLFEKYGYNFNTVDEQGQELLLTYGILDNMQEIFSYLFSNNLLTSKLEIERLTNLLLYSNIKIIDNVLQIAKAKGMNIDNIFKQTGLFISKKRDGLSISKQYSKKSSKKMKEKYGSTTLGAYENYLKNIEILTESGINLQLVGTQCPSILSYYPPTVRRNINLFNIYGIDIASQTQDCISLSVLNSLSLFNNIDNLLELGFDYINDKTPFRTIQSITDKQMRRLKEAKISNKLIFRKYISTPDRFSINKEELDNPLNDENRCVDVIFNGIEKINEITSKSNNDKILDLVYKNNYISYLEQNNKLNNLYYLIDGVKISRIKVLRIYSTLLTNGINDIDSIYYAITYKSLLTDEELKTIKRNINDNPNLGRGVR